MKNEWYFRSAGDYGGPISLDELSAMAASGRLKKDDVVRCGDLGIWNAADDIKELEFPASDPGVSLPFTVSDLGNGKPSASQRPRSPSNEPDDAFLDDLEDVLIRMTKGVFVVPFVKAPNWLWKVLRRLFPQLVKSLRVLMWGWLWCTAGFGPAILLVFHKGQLPFGLPVAMQSHSQFVRAVTLVLTTAWTVLAGVVGSIYGFNYLKARKRRLAARAASPSFQSNSKSTT